MKIKAKQFGLLLHEITRECSREEVKERVRAFTRLLFQHRMTRRTVEIIESFRKAYNEEHGILDVEVRGVYPLGKSLMDEITRMIEKETGAREVEIVEKKDPSLIGGFRVSFGSHVFDSSIARKLKKLKAHINL